MSDRPMIEAEGLQKRYGAEFAVRSVDLAVPAGRILGVLGPNGAGKSTTVRMLATMTRPDGGAARVGGFDVVADARAVRRIIGVTGQDASLDELLTGTQNLVMVGELSKLPRRGAQARAAELLERFGLTDAAGRMVKTYSGGMRRRLDLAASLMARPPVLFLDEPTTGLDPASRQSMWGVIRDLVAEGTTVLLTTQYLDEADALADAIVVIDHGTVIATGTARELKARIGGEQLEVTLAADRRAAGPAPFAASHAGDTIPPLAPARAGSTDDAIAALAPLVAGPIQVTDGGRKLTAPIVARHGIATAVIRALDGVGVAVDDIAVHRPSLDDVFFALTGRPADPAPADSVPAEPAPVDMIGVGA